MTLEEDHLRTSDSVVTTCVLVTVSLQFRKKE